LRAALEDGGQTNGRAGARRKDNGSENSEVSSFMAL